MRISNFFGQMVRRIRQHRHSISFTCEKLLGRTYVRLAILQAEIHLKKTGPIVVLVDNSILGHGITHETAWIDTGQELWGGQVPVDTGYAARIPVHKPDSSNRIYTEVTYLVGIAELARRGHIRLVTSAELLAEKWRQPIGRFGGYRFLDLNIFEGIQIPSVDGHKFDRTDQKAAQQARLAGSTAEPFATLAALLPKKSNLDAWHIHTAHEHKLFCFLAMDFPLSDNFERASKSKRFPHLDTRLMLPSELAEAIQLRPVETFAISHERSNWFVHSELHTPDSQRTPLRKGMLQFRKSDQKKMTETDPPAPKSPITTLPAVGEMMGAEINASHEAVSIQYKDKTGKLQQLAMPLGDAMYLLSVLKAMQLNLDIPFPDDPRDPDAIPIRPSERSGSETKR